MDPVEDRSRSRRAHIADRRQYHLPVRVDLRAVDTHARADAAEALARARTGRVRHCWPQAPEVASLAWLDAGTRFTVPPVLFAKITEDDVDQWRERFGAEDEIH
nr:hypothetical protein [Nocardia abscessus]